MEFQKGDIVEIKELGMVYSTYTSMFKKFQFKNLEYNHFPRIDDKIQWKGSYKIFGLCLHEHKEQGYVVAIEHIETGVQILIGDEGIIKV